MNITYNEISAPSGIVTFTDIPNILKVEDESGGTYATLTLGFGGGLKGLTTDDGQWYITFLGETITNVLDPSKAVGKNFYVSSSPVSTAMSVARALRNCPAIVANFDIVPLNAAVFLTARGVGSLWGGMQDYFSTNITQHFTPSAVDGTAYSPLNGSIINVDIYSDNKYVTTLEKSWYGGEACFNLSPVLATISSPGRVVPYDFRIGSTKDGEWGYVGSGGTNYSSVGYMCNQGLKYIDNNSYMNIAQNFSRGAQRDVANSTILYVYEPVIPISFYAGSNGGMTITVDYLDSAFNITATTSTRWRNTDSSRILWDLELPLDGNGGTAFQRAFYIDVTLGSDKVRYNVIKPLKATEYSQRILWRNSYNGISFFDFTGQRSETRSLETSTYQRNIFDYYTNPRNELEKIFDNNVTYSVTLKSHLFENDGKYVFNDLAQSSEVWTVINGETYSVIIDSVSVDEVDRNDVYEATVRYRYSMHPSLI